MSTTPETPEESAHRLATKALIHIDALWHDPGAVGALIYNETRKVLLEHFEEIKALSETAPGVRVRVSENHVDIFPTAEDWRKDGDRLQVIAPMSEKALVLNEVEIIAVYEKDGWTGVGYNNGLGGITEAEDVKEGSGRP